jgi:hypothetical protein
MLVDLLHIELAKLVLTHLLEILHTKLDSVHVVSMLMQSAPIIPAPTWAAQMHLAAPKKAQSVRCG